MPYHFHVPWPIHFLQARRYHHDGGIWLANVGPIAWNKSEFKKNTDKASASAGRCWVGFKPLSRQVRGSTVAQKMYQWPNTTYGLTLTFSQLFPNISWVPDGGSTKIPIFVGIWLPGFFKFINAIRLFTISLPVFMFVLPFSTFLYF